MARTSFGFRQHAGESITIYVKNFHLFINDNRIPLPSL